jgi:rubrerythrin
MASVLIVERPKTCHVFCECGYVAMMTAAPHVCPECGQVWDSPRFEECN